MNPNWKWNKVYYTSIRTEREMSSTDARQSLEKHMTTQKSCDCEYFIKSLRQRTPCKHIIRFCKNHGYVSDSELLSLLALDEDDPAFSKDKSFRKIEEYLARYCWHYYVLQKPEVTNEEYDRLKSIYFNAKGIKKVQQSCCQNKQAAELSMSTTYNFAVITPSTQLGLIPWRIIDIDNEKATLWAFPIIQAPFFDLDKCKEARYIRTDYSGNNKSKGLLLKTQSDGSQIGDDSGAARRYTDIMQYGSNQWAVSTLREYLNSSFLNSMPDDFQDAVIPQKHTLLLRKVLYSGKINRTTERQAYSDTVEVYDKFEEDGLRYTYSEVTDSIYLPSIDADPVCKRLFSIPENMVQSQHYWLMDARIDTDGDPYMVKIVTNCKDSLGRIRASLYDGNAYQTRNIAVCPMCVIKAEYIRKQSKHLF